MANTKMKGITITIGGDTTGLQDSLKDVNKQIGDTNYELKQVEKLLKFDPSNVVLLTQKQKLLDDAIKSTTDKLKQLKLAKEQADASDDVDKSSKGYRELEREIQATEQKLKSLSNETKELSTNMEDAKENGLSFADVLKANILSDVIVGGLQEMGNLIKQIASGMVSIVKDGVSYNAQMEQYMTSFSAMLGSTEDAQKMIDSIKKGASASPFDIASLVSANQMLLTTGESAEKTEKVINALGDAVAYTGGGNSELTRMASNLQQIKNVGKASSVDIKQFAMAGINIYGILAESMNKSVDQVKEMDISYEDLTKALIKASEEGGMYFGAMERQSNTLTGQLNKLQSNWDELTGVIANDTTNALQNDFIPSINDAMESMINWQEQGFGSLGDAMASGISDILTTIVEQTPSLIEGGFELISEIADGLLKKDEDGKSVLETTFEQLTEKLLTFVTNPDFYKKLLSVGLAIGKGILEGITNKLMELSTWLNESFSLDGQYINFANMELASSGYGGLNSKGFNQLKSGGFASGGISLTTNINVNNNGNNISTTMVESWAKQMAQTINEELGAMI